MIRRPQRVLLRKFARFWSRWFWTFCVHDWGLTYGSSPTFQVCPHCHCCRAPYRRMGWRLLRNKGGTLVYWFGPFGPGGFAFEGDEILGCGDRRWSIVNRNHRKVQAAI